MLSGFTLVMLTQVSDTNEYAEQELMDHFLLNAMGQPRDPPLDKQDFVKVRTYVRPYKDAGIGGRGEKGIRGFPCFRVLIFMQRKHLRKCTFSVH